MILIGFRSLQGQCKQHWMMCYPPALGWSTKHNKNGNSLLILCSWQYHRSNNWLNRNCSNCSHRKCCFKKAIISVDILLIFVYKHLSFHGECRFSSVSRIARRDGSSCSAHFTSICYKTLCGDWGNSSYWTQGQSFYGMGLLFQTITSISITSNNNISLLSIFDSTRTSRVKPGLFSFSIEKSMRNVWLHARDNHLCYVLGTKRRISNMQTIIIPRKIRIVLSRVEMPEAPPLRQVLRLHLSDRTGNGKKIVIGGTQRRGRFDRVSWRFGS